MHQPREGACGVHLYFYHPRPPLLAKMHALPDTSDHYTSPVHVYMMQMVRELTTVFCLPIAFILICLFRRLLQTYTRQPSLLLILLLWYSGSLLF